MTELRDFGDLSEMPWRYRLPHMLAADFTDAELDEIANDAAMDLLRTSQLRTLVILLAEHVRKQP